MNPVPLPARALHEKEQHTRDDLVPKLPTGSSGTYTPARESHPAQACSRDATLSFTILFKASDREPCYERPDGNTSCRIQPARLSAPATVVAVVVIFPLASTVIVPVILVVFVFRVARWRRGGLSRRPPRSTPSRAFPSRSAAAKQSGRNTTRITQVTVPTSN